VSDPDDTEDDCEVPSEPPDSGPFCQHWHDPSDCGVVCAACGDACWLHREGRCDGPGGPFGCPCAGFVDEEDER
jgi:hypothetical protein